MDDFADIANQAWESDLPPHKYALYDLMNEPRFCRICEQNEWTVERELDDGTVILTCSHGTVEGLGFRQCDSASIKDFPIAIELDIPAASE